MNSNPTGACSSLALPTGASGGHGSAARALTQSDDDVRGLASSSGASGFHLPARALTRTPELDRRVALHESGHILCGKAFGFAVGFATVDPSGGYAGMVRASADSSFLSPTHIADLCAKVRPLMPAIGEPRADIAEFHAHAHCRTIELLAGSESERLFFADDPPLRAEHDLQEARSFAGIICTSPTSVDAFIAYARVEARAMLADHRHVVQALALALVERRTLDGTEIDTIIAQAIAEQDLAAEKVRQARWRGVQANAEQFTELLGRGKCREMSGALLRKDPTLTLVFGYYHCPVWGKQAHWWTKAPDGTIHDPTKDQFPSKGIGTYAEIGVA